MKERMALTDEERTRMIGVRDGLSHALISVRAVMGSITGPSGIYLPPKRYIRKRAAQEAKLKVLGDAEAMIDKQLKAVQQRLSL